MKNLKSAAKLATLGLTLVASSSVFALGDTKTADFTVILKIIPSLQLASLDAGIDFGVQAFGETEPVTIGTGHADSASFSLTGLDGYPVSVTLATNSLNMELGGASGGDADKEIPVTNFQMSDGTATANGDATLTVANLPATVTVGATATPSDTDEVGDYTATNTLSAVYQ